MAWGSINNRHLSRLTKNERYRRAVWSVYNKLFELPIMDGLFPDSISNELNHAYLTPLFSILWHRAEEGV